ncbi:O-antigen ligase family protein [Dolichospermum flos-aquae]|uniref:O-antigen ligase family protein n=1 Tax=Dolichospermum flos-aquae CCAP 1403/13F TaxID=315271 RepID=A0A6H2BYI4_DOLFA|nr:O-antigen ligase family protein [Dolichospermum flos-aquae]QJB44632.1 O-antigen ligase family protein [Dolichospermum flos-aquae CCAP 1403/13F]
MIPIICVFFKKIRLSRDIYLLYAALTISIVVSCISFEGATPRQLTGLVFIVFGWLGLLCGSLTKITKNDSSVMIGGITLFCQLVFSFLYTIMQTNISPTNLITGFNLVDYYILKDGLVTPFGSSNYLAAFLLFFIGYFLVTRKINLLIISLLGIFFTLSRTGIIIVVIFLVIFGLIKLYQKQIKYNTAKNLLLISSFTICLAFLSTWLGNSLQENATQHTLDNISTLTNRTVLWESASEIISEHPWFGNGFGSLVDLPALKSVAGETGIWSAHNGLLDYWLAHGIFSMLIFLAYIYFIMFKLYKLSTHSLNHQERSSALGIFIGLFLMLIHGLVEPLLFDSKFLIFIGLIAGGITSSNQYVDGRINS